MLSIQPNPRITYRIAHQDDEILVVEKASGLTTLPGKGHDDDTLLNGLFETFGYTLQNIGRSRDFGLLHRLDKDTSGLLIVALTPHAYDTLRQDFADRQVNKYYWAVCQKPPTPAQGVIRLPIVETPGGELHRNRQKLAHVAGKGKSALTAYRVLDTSELAALVEAHPVTGRLHQVRVHFDAVGAPILGDGFYGNSMSKRGASRLALHAHRLTFTHPTTGEAIDIRTRWPADLRRLMRLMRLERPDLAKRAPDAEPSDTGLPETEHIDGVGDE